MRLVLLILLIFILALLLLGCVRETVYYAPSGYPAQVVYDRPVYETPVRVYTTDVAVPVQRVWYPYARARWEVCC